MQQWRQNVIDNSYGLIKDINIVGEQVSQDESIGNVFKQGNVAIDVEGQ